MKKNHAPTVGDGYDIVINVAKIEAGYKAFSGEHFKVTKMSGNPIIINVPDDGKGIKVKYVVQWKQHDSS